MEAERRKKYGALMRRCREGAGLSQEAMAAELGISRETVRSIERGSTQMKDLMTIEWIEICGENPEQVLHEFITPMQHDLASADTDISTVRKGIVQHFKDCSDTEILQMAYVMHGKHGSSWEGVRNEMVCNLHTNLMLRTIVCNTIMHNYRMCEQLGDMVCPDSIAPDMALLELAFQNGTRSAQQGNEAYNIANKDVPK